MEEDSKISDSNHDFGKNVIPMLLNQGKEIFIYNFAENHFPGMTKKEKGYWRDVGCIDAYWQANMDLLEYEPELDLYSKDWPLRTFNYNYPPAKFICGKVIELEWLRTQWFLKDVLFRVVQFPDVFFLRRLKLTVILRYQTVY